MIKKKSGRRHSMKRGDERGGLIKKRDQIGLSLTCRKGKKRDTISEIEGARVSWKKKKSEKVKLTSEWGKGDKKGKNIANKKSRGSGGGRGVRRAQGSVEAAMREILKITKEVPVKGKEDSAKSERLSGGRCPPRR